ncbi:hypothetical protein [Gimesia maris]|uniref:hypothetical protein n=1 Tax=Gimesia maris TaxID=122 RepID=UPI0030DA86A4
MVPDETIAETDLGEKEFMIYEFLFGVVVSLILMIVFKGLQIRRSVDSWILSIAKFVYHSGHPLYDDDQRFRLAKQAYKPVVFSFLQVLFRIVLIVLLVGSTIALLAITLESARGENQKSFFSPELWRESAFPQYLLHWPFIAGTLLPLILLPFLPKTSGSWEYSALDKFLHYLFLGNRGITRLQWCFECIMNRKELVPPLQQVYIAGLARSGSTSLMQHLGQLPEFVSLSYRNMPFVLMPRTGPKLISRKTDKERERSHKDGMLHSLSTYEALEEPFWLHFAGPDFIQEERLIQHNVAEDIHVEYQKFRSMVAGGKTYLMKNNNHLLRAKSLHRLDAGNELTTKTVIPFREPYAQAKSLLEQHNILSKLQKEDDFALDYMDLLVHHEFGLHSKILLLGEYDDESLTASDPSCLEHWLRVWHVFYRDAFDLYAGEPDFCFFCYEKYLANPRGSLLSLCPFLDIDAKRFEAIEVKEWRRTRSEQDESTVPSDSRQLYDKLVKVAINHEV